MSTPDPNLTRWGLHELQGSGYNHSNNNNYTGPGGVNTQDQYVNDNLGVASMPLRHIEPAPSTTSDALIAQALQEEFQRLDAAGAPGASAPPAQEQVYIFTFGLVFENALFFLATIATLLNFFAYNRVIHYLNGTVYRELVSYKFPLVGLHMISIVLFSLMVHVEVVLEFE